MIDLAALTWTCHVCGKERPDQMISVATHTRIYNESQNGQFTIQENVRYCNDHPGCREVASRSMHSELQLAKVLAEWRLTLDTLHRANQNTRFLLIVMGAYIAFNVIMLLLTV